MAVNVGQRNVPDTPQNQQLQACAKAKELALHTLAMYKYYKELWKGANKNVLHKKDTVYQAGKGNRNPQGKSGKAA